MKSYAFAAILGVVFADYHEGADVYDGPIAPTSYGYAVNDFDINEPTIDAECYEHQVDIYSDQIVAIEATRVILTKLIKRVEWAEEEIDDNAHEIADNKDEIRENDWETRANAADIEELNADIDDIDDCYWR